MSGLKLEKKPTVLIADDDPSTRMLLRATITQWDYPVLEANDGGEAWELICSSDNPQIVTVDWMMPNINGIDLCKRAKKLSKPPYMILLTGLSGAANIVNALDAGADDFLTKPFNYAELRSRIFVGHRIINFTNKLETVIKEQNTNVQQLPIVFNKIAESSQKIHAEWNLLQQYLQSLGDNMRLEDRQVLQKIAHNIFEVQQQLSNDIQSIEKIAVNRKSNHSKNQ